MMDFRYVAGRKEAQILGKLNEADPDDKKHIVRMEHTFEHRGHLCIVTESLWLVTARLQGIHRAETVVPA